MRLNSSRLMITAAFAIFMQSSVFCDRSFGQNSGNLTTSFAALVDAIQSTAEYNLSPPSLSGRNVALYKSPHSQPATYFIAPMLLPDWSALKSAIDVNCTASAGEAEFEVKMWLEFSRESIRLEIANIVSNIENRPISSQKIFIYPYAWITVFTGANRVGTTPKEKQIPVRKIAEYPSGTSSNAGPQALRITAPEPILATIVAPCAELRSIYEHRDISGKFFAPYKDVETNSFTAEYAAFLTKSAFADMMRGENQEGNQTVRSRSRGKGSGINIGGVFGDRKSKAEIIQQNDDSRKRTISANLIRDAAAAYSETLLTRRWQEFGSEDVAQGKIAEELLNFVKANSTSITADIKQINDDQWKLVSGSEERSLSREQLKQLVESSSKLNIDFSQKASIGCPGEGKSDNPYCATVDNKFNGIDDNGIKWNEEGGKWVPTSIKLYAVSVDSLSRSADASIVDVRVKNKGMLTADLQPVAGDMAATDDWLAVVKREIAYSETRIKSSVDSAFAQLANSADVPPPNGWDTMGAPHPGTGSACRDGTYMIGLQTWMEDGHLKAQPKCRKIIVPSVK